MKVEDMILVSIDDHVIEPADMFQKYVPSKWADEAPKLVEVDGITQWLFMGERTGNMGLNAVVGWPKEEWGMDPVGLAEMRPGAYDLHERIRDMNRNGVFASMCFSTFPGFSGRHLNAWASKNEELTKVILQAYNNWHVEECWGT